MAKNRNRGGRTPSPVEPPKPDDAAPADVPVAEPPKVDDALPAEPTKADDAPETDTEAPEWKHPAVSEPCIRGRLKKRVTGYLRGGVRWSTSWTLIPLGNLSRAQLSAIEDDELIESERLTP